MYRRLTSSCLAILAFCLLSPALWADPIWGSVTHTSPNMTGEVPVLLTAGANGTLNGSLYTIQGATSPGGVTVNISTDSDGSSGVDHLFANTAVQLYANPLGSSDTSIDQLTFSAEGHTFTDSVMDLFGAFDGSDTVTFVVTTSAGTFTHIFTGLTSNNTDNWISLTTANGETISSVSLSDTRFYALQNLNLSGVASTPEPASLLMIATGICWLASRKRRA
jgi:hypothetical protein